jgi:hypothetical protein
MQILFKLRHKPEITYISLLRRYVSMKSRREYLHCMVSYVGFPVRMCVCHLSECLVRANFERNMSSATIEFSGKEKDDVEERT